MPIGADGAPHRRITTGGDASVHSNTHFSVWWSTAAQLHGQLMREPLAGSPAPGYGDDAGDGGGRPRGAGRPT